MIAMYMGEAFALSALFLATYCIVRGLIVAVRKAIK